MKNFDKWKRSLTMDKLNEFIQVKRCEGCQAKTRCKNWNCKENFERWANREAK